MKNTLFVIIFSFFINIMCNSTAFAEPMDVDLIQLIEASRENEYAFQKKYSDKELKFTAIVYSISAECSYMAGACIKLTHKDIKPNSIPVIAKAFMSDNDDLEDLYKQQEITLVCHIKCTNTEYGLEFNDCKLVDKNFSDPEWWDTATLEDVENEIKNGASINAIRGGATALHFAVTRSKNPEIVETLLKNGANIEAKDDIGLTPLAFAVVKGLSEIVETLLKNGSDVNAQLGEVDATVLHVAALSEHPEIVETLLKNGANIEAKDKDGETPLMKALESSSNPQIVENLLKHGASMEAKSKERFKAWAYVGVNKNIEIVETVLKYNTDIEGIAEALVMSCLKNSNPKVIKILLDHFEDVRSLSKDAIDGLLKILDKNTNIEKNQDYWDLRDRIYNATNR